MNDFDVEPPQTTLGACPHDCPDTCALVTTVRHGVAIKVQGNPDHPATAGVLCTKVSKYAERTHHPERLLHPLKRVGPKGSGQFQPVGWDEALADITQRLQHLAAQDPRAIAPYSYAGTMGLVQGEGMAARFFHRLGASLLDRTICASAGAEALVQTLGGKVGMRVEAFAGAKVIVIWGSNAIASHLHFWRHVQEAKRHGATLVCIDPRRTETAEKCHHHLAIRPGTDGALALALMREFTVNGWLDADYIERHTLGWDGVDEENGRSRFLKKRCMLWNVERAAEVCGVPAQAIRDLARLMGETARRNEPVAIRLNYGMQRVRGGGNAVRAVACLPALLGSWRHVSGGLLMSSSGAFPVRREALFRPDLLPQGLNGRAPRTLNMSTVGQWLNAAEGDPILAGGPRVQALVVYNSNPVAVAPHSGDVVRGFARDDLFTVVLEQFQTDTADWADYILPATTQLEHWDIHTSYGHTDVLLNRPAIAPLGESRPNTQVFRDLAARMGFADACFAESDEALCRQAFDPADVDFDTLLARGWVPLPARCAPLVPFAHGGFPTPSGRCEFFSQRLADQGLDGLPDHVPNLESAQHNAELARRYPLAMISPPARNFLNSTFVNVQSLRDVEGEPLLEIHPADAAARGIADRARVRVFNDRGSHHCTARVSERARPGVVNGLGIWWRKLGLNGTNVNELTGQALTDLGRAPTFYDCLVQVEEVVV
ncbi:molybdopterin-containing oxidoreductase family protein [Hydrogenophaga soli]